MKTIQEKITFLFILLISFAVSSCDKSHDEWEDGDPNLAHVYYYCFEKWGKIPGGNDVVYATSINETIAIPTQFHSKYVRPYTPEVYYYTAPVKNSTELTCGVDYVVVDKDNNVLQPNESGAYKMCWPNAAGGVQNIYIKAISNKKGAIKVLTFDPSKKMDVTDVSTTSIIKTNEYEVRAISDNYFVTLSIN